MDKSTFIVTVTKTASEVYVIDACNHESAMQLSESKFDMKYRLYQDGVKVVVEAKEISQSNILHDYGIQDSNNG